MARGLYEGSPAGSVSIEVADELAKDALRKAYMRAMALGYEPGKYDLELGVLEMYYREGYFAFERNLFIWMKLDMSTSPPVLTMRGADMEPANEEWQVMEDMKTIRDAVKKCCAAR